MIIKNITDIKEIQKDKVVIGLGNFDGVHLGHQHLIKYAASKAKELGIKSAVMTFANPIDKVLKKEFAGEITPIEKKIEYLKELNIDYLYLLDFNDQTMSIEALDFIKQFLDKLNIEEIVVGDDYRFGRFGQGNNELLKKFYKVNVVDYEFEENGNKISSSTIIKNIVNGEIDVAAKYLGKRYQITGKVIKGLQNGRKLVVPTANIDTSGYVLPKDGVYAVNIIVNKVNYNGLAYVGTHPTIDQTECRNLEVFILDFSGEIYDLVVSVDFIKFIRESMKFDSVENLKNQIKIDTFFNF